MNFGRRLLLPILWLISVCSSPSAQIVLLPSADTSLWQRAPTNNLGASDILPAGTVGADGPFTRSRLLVKFDLSAQLPANAIIESASVYFRVVRAPDPEKGSNNSPFSGHRILKDWGEGNKTYTDPQTPMTSTQAATAGEATWRHRFHGDDATLWTPAGGDFTDDDFAEASSFGFFMQAGADRDYTATFTASGLQDLRDWLVNPEENFGWVLITEEENLPSTGRQIASREFATPEYRPQLTINYSLPEPAAPQIQSITRNGVQVTVRFSAQASIVYRPQHRPLVHTGGWADLPDLGPLATDGTLEFTDDLTGVNERYYQVIAP
ncbi:MAG TPA: DNRLRE domain-containing protein [Verrucomicrobiae bacterium]|nr:DNRLRE domain-containing protein [Verrucomicrobiae bacterium]